MSKITIIQSVRPEKVCKTYSMENGVIKKTAIANIFDGKGATVKAETADDMVRILKRVTERTDLALCAGIWHNSELGKPFGIYTEKKLAELLGSELGKVQGGVVEHNGELISARLKRGIDYSEWMLLDADNPEGIPDEWAAMTIAERLTLWEPFVPGISACERIELRGSSARVYKVEDGEPNTNATHAWIRVSDPDKISTLKAHIDTQMVLHGASFRFPIKSKLTGEVIGGQDRSVFDLAVLDTGRLVFCAKPEVLIDGYAVADAGITIHNPAGGALDISWAEVPTQRDLELLRTKTGLSKRVSVESGNVSTIVTGELTDDTPIEIKGSVRRLKDWADEMQPGDKKRCESPFRFSQSEAAFIKIGDNGLPFVHDIGNGTTYKMQRELVLRDDLSDFDYIPEEPTAREKEVVEVKHEDFKQEGGFADWAFLTRRGAFYNIFTGEECKTQAFNLAYGRDVPEVQDGDKITRPSASRYVMHFIDGRTAYDTLYMPSALSVGSMFFERDGVQYVNSYIPTWVPKVDPNWRDGSAWKVCDAHLKMILPNDYNAVLQWMAFNVQNPGQKLLWAPIIKGIQGDGKSTLARMLGAAMGHSNVRQIGPESLQSDFNGWAEGSCVGVLEEIRVKGHNRHDAMNKLKPLITNEIIEVVRKGQDGRNIPNTTNYMALTNHEDALVLDADDRRWGVFFTKFKDRSQMVAETGKDYWARLNDAINNNGSEIRGWLMSIDLSDFDRTDAPAMTEAKKAMIASSRSDDEVMIEELIELGGYGVTKMVVSTSDLTELARRAGLTLKTNRMSKVMEMLGYSKLDKVFKWHGKARRIYLHENVSELARDTDAARADIRSMLDVTLPIDDFDSV